MRPRRKGPLRKTIKCTPTELGHYGHLKLRWMEIGHDTILTWWWWWWWWWFVRPMCFTIPTTNSYFPLPPSKKCTSLWLLSWMVPLTVKSAATTESSSCIHEPRAACICRPHVDQGSRSGIFCVGLCLQTLSWVLDNLYIMYCNAISCTRSWSFNYSYYITHSWHVSV